MKKTLAIVLSLIMLLTFVTPALATGKSDFKGKIPVVIITGEGEPIVDKDGNVLFDANDFFGNLGNSGSQTKIEAAANILMPMLLEGVLLDKWDRYYDALYNEVSDLFAGVILDENGNPTGGTSIPAERFAENEEDLQIDKKDRNGNYAFSDYHFWYDWRLDPLENAEYFNDYIEGVKAITGHDKVCIVTRCIGHSVLLAYIAKYGTGSIYGLGVDGSSSNGSEFISGALSGDFSIDGNSIARYVEDSENFGMFKVDSLLTATFTLLENSGALDKMSEAARKLIYLKIEKGVVSAVARGTIFTMPCFWALVSEDKYETAKEYVFGKEGSKMREKYAVLIEKLDNYHNTVCVHRNELMSAVPESGGNICIVSKYGSQIIPIIKDGNLVGDSYSSVTSSSFGATTSKLGETLSDEYIAERIAEGKGEYISPDRQIDASTCLFPDSTYFVKGVKHADWSKVENNIIMRTIQGETQLTVRDLEYSQFVITFPESDEWEVMTEENCDTEVWTDDSMAGKPKTKWERLKLFIESMVNWLKLLLVKITSMLEK